MMMTVFDEKYRQSNSQGWMWILILSSKKFPKFQTLKEESQIKRLQQDAQFEQALKL